MFSCFSGSVKTVLPGRNRAWFLSARQKEAHEVPHAKPSQYITASPCHAIKIKSWKNVALISIRLGKKTVKESCNLSKETFTGKDNLSSCGNSQQEILQEDGVTLDLTEKTACHQVKWNTPQRQHEVYRSPGTGVLLQKKRSPVWWHSIGACHLGCSSLSYKRGKSFLFRWQGNI